MWNKDSTEICVIVAYPFLSPFNSPFNLLKEIINSWMHSKALLEQNPPLV